MSRLRSIVSVASFIVIGILPATTTAFSKSVISFFGSPTHTTHSSNKKNLATQLYAIHPSSSHNGMSSASRGFPSRTAMESAVNVEWEPMTELERRLEDGVNYEHIVDPPHRASSQHTSKLNGSTKRFDNIPTARAIFCGYKATQEEYSRLKSADPLD